MREIDINVDIDLAFIVCRRIPSWNFQPNDFDEVMQLFSITLAYPISRELYLNTQDVTTICDSPFITPNVSVLLEKIQFLTSSNVVCFEYKAQQSCELITKN